MLILVKLLGIVMVTFGVIYLISPDVMKRYIAFWAKGKRIYTGGVLSILIGVILFLTAPQCKLV